MPKPLTAESSRNTFNPALLALKPRQVLISRPVMGKESKALSLKSEQKVIVLRSVAQYLERCGFSKCFKKLLSEAEIEKKELNSSLPDLDEVFCEFFKKSHVEAAEVKESGIDEDRMKKAGNLGENASDDHETDKKDKKKEVAEVSGMEGVDKVKKEKKKKKKKEPKLEVTKEEEKVKESDAEIEDGLKEKKKKKKKTKSKSSETESLGDDKEKVSKKRKRSEPEETKEQTEDDEESKRMKKEENVVEDDEGVQETPVKQADVQENGNVEKSGTKSGKGLSNSKEPKKPFQRVNVEEIVFTDDRLKDNSYWAKDGADSGYGAKAQEVLGQVKGRGFRHEKTKKKRGSYRGGEIDLQSHSVKFEYSDEE